MASSYFYYGLWGFYLVSIYRLREGGLSRRRKNAKGKEAF
jgi:hypothetical protein